MKEQEKEIQELRELREKYRGIGGRFRWCDTCKEPWASERCNTCKYGYGSKNNYKPMTNADASGGMSVEKLAETYAGGCPKGDRLNCGKYYLHGGRDCFNCWLDWLKAPVEEG